MEIGHGKLYIGLGKVEFGRGRLEIMPGRLEIVPGTARAKSKTWKRDLETAGVSSARWNTPTARVWE